MDIDFDFDLCKFQFLLNKMENRNIKNKMI